TRRVALLAAARRALPLLAEARRGRRRHHLSTSNIVGMRQMPHRQRISMQTCVVRWPLRQSRFTCWIMCVPCSRTSIRTPSAGLELRQYKCQRRLTAMLEIHRLLHTAIRHQPLTSIRRRRRRQHGNGRMAVIVSACHLAVAPLLPSSRERPTANRWLTLASVCVAWTLTQATATTMTQCHLNAIARVNPHPHAY
ncbi:hypothetical protein GGH95_003568, partial [Coemansia sp. RSA 1836]